MLGIAQHSTGPLRLLRPQRLLALLPSNQGRRHYKGRDSQAPRNKWFLAFPAICFGLGTWQVYRRRWKLDLIESLSRRTSQPPIVVPPDASVTSQLLPGLAELEYRPVTLTGEFDHSAEVLIGPRHLMEAGEFSTGGGSLFSSGANVGYHVVTPFRLANSAGERVLVNRGWVPARFADPATRPQGQTPGRVTLTGLVRLSDPPSALLGNSNGAATRITGQQSRVTCRLRRDVESLSRELDTLPVFVDACLAADDDGGGGDGRPIGGQTRLSLRNEHLSYIVTWYSLGALLAALWFMRVR